MASKLNIDTLTNAMVLKKLGLSSTEERHFDIFPTEVLERYFGECSQSAKAYRTRDIPDPFFLEIAKFLLEVVCVHLNTYGMPKQKVGVMIFAFEGQDVDWGVIIGMTLREGIHAFKSGKKLRPIIQQYFTILFHPSTTPAPATRPERRCLEEIMTSTWDEDINSCPTASSPRRRSCPPQADPTQALVVLPMPTPTQEAEGQATSLQRKCQRLDQRTTKDWPKI